MAGDGALFTREDAVEAAWAAVDPVLETHQEVRPYHRRSWGPKEADAIIAADGGWHNPGPKEGIGSIMLMFSANQAVQDDDRDTSGHCGLVKREG